MTINDVLEYGFHQFKEISDVPRKEIELLVMYVCGLKKIDLILNSNETIKKEALVEIEALVNKRLEGKPLQYIIGSEEFMGLNFIVTENVLIPRQDTEILVEEIISRFKKESNLQILEIGTGSGAISVSLAKFLKKSKIVSLDISRKALSVAKLNAKKNHVADQITFIESNLFEDLTEEESFDIIVSNPPYIPSMDILELQREVKDYEPMLALDGGEDGLEYYREITKKSVDYLKKDGLLAYEIGYDQGIDVLKILKNDFHHIEIIKDLQKHDRVVLGYHK
ncbi:MAG TPA: peptide chain release factor N(5)-glutamine methyltransferase [Clostridia bacterium]|nr:peptide chain release factor N(5)-glutamine methyltransferase [Clostridia bacterium]